METSLTAWMSHRAHNGSVDPCGVELGGDGQFSYKACSSYEIASEALQKGGLLRFGGSRSKARITVVPGQLSAETVVRLRQEIEDAAPKAGLSHVEIDIWRQT